MQQNRYDKSNVLVLGIGLSGEWAARLLLSRGCTVTVLDENDNEELMAAAERVCELGGAVRLGKEGLPHEAYDVCVTSPAFALDHPWIVECADRVIPVISELELGAHYWRKKILAVTGSKGKSSFVKFCAETLNRSGISAAPAGNYGVPLCQLAMEKPALKWAVVEVSSFQLEHAPTFHPHIAVLLNIQPDHLDRHGSMEEYRAVKMRMFANMDMRCANPSKGACLGERDLTLFPADIDVNPAILAQTRCLRFGNTPDCDWYYVPSAVRIKQASPQLLGVNYLGNYSIAGSWFDNDVLGPAAAAAVAVLLHAGLVKSAIEEGFRRFEPLEHRMQTLGVDARGVTWVDDSKATSLTALGAALRMTRKPVRLIAGGVLKENDLNFLKEVLAETTKKVYLIGQCAEQMADAWASVVSCEIYGTVECAVAAAAQEAQCDETVLLSPGTASFDQFSSYRERGERFTQLARAVAGL